jgi:peptidyl-dipeptidase Dcp
MNEYVSQSALLGNHPVVANHLNIPKPPAGEPTLLTVRRSAHRFPRVRPCAARHVLEREVPALLGHPRAARLRRVSVAGQRDVGRGRKCWPTTPSTTRPARRCRKSCWTRCRHRRSSTGLSSRPNTWPHRCSTSAGISWRRRRSRPTCWASKPQALKDAGVDFAPVPPRYRTTYFSHSFSGGYSAGYYAYLWSRKAGRRHRRMVQGKRRPAAQERRPLPPDAALARRHADAMDLFRNFRGRDAKIEPLLERRGLTGTQ